MNYLAHFLLSFDDADVLQGQFIADDLKGRSYTGKRPGVVQGVLLHRYIDSYTDTDPSTMALRALVRPELGLFSSPSIDIFFDHFLARDWASYGPGTLESFAEKVYSDLISQKEELSEKRKFILHHMEAGNWLLSYRTLEGMERAFHGLSRRVQGGAVLLKATESLRSNYVEAEGHFADFFPRLKKACIIRYGLSPKIS